MIVVNMEVLRGPEVLKKFYIVKMTPDASWSHVPLLSLHLTCGLVW